jgi:hypothetical protein
MGNLTDLDMNDVAEQREFRALPAGSYTAIATESEKKVTKAGTGHYLQFTFEIIDGSQKGRKLWARMNLWNPNQTAVGIAKREFQAFYKAVGFTDLPSDSSDLHNKPVTLDVGIEIDDRKRENNVVKGYSSAGGIVSKAVSAVASAVTGNSTPPWMR